MGLSLPDCVEFCTIISALRKYFAPVALTSAKRSKLRAQIRAEGESLPSLCSSIRRQVVEAYPSLDTHAHGELALEYFVGALHYS